MSKKDYIIIRFYMGNFDGYLQKLNNSHEYTNNKLNATSFTLKQAGKIVFTLNREMKRINSYYYRYGYYMSSEV